MADLCPDRRALSDYLAGRVSPEAARQIENHLPHCSGCQAAVEAASLESDSLLAAMRGMAASNSLDKEPELARVLCAIGNLGSVVGPSTTLPANASPAQTFIRDYHLLEKMCEGGMGAVYKARHTKLDKVVALKVLKAGRERDAAAISRFMREMRAVGPLEHPHIVQALDAGDENGVYFLVMEYIPGVDLSRLVGRLGQLLIADACELIRQAALGLHYAHQNNRVHRDVKPSNLMLSSEGRVKVLDLGLAQLQDSLGESRELTRDGQLLGTFLYMAPEQLMGSRQVDARSDVYSLGVSLFELLAGGLPRQPSQRALVLPDLRDVRDDAPAEIRRVVKRMIAPAPADRVESMAQVAELLGPFATDADPAALVQRFKNETREARSGERPPALPRSSSLVGTPAASVTRTEHGLTTVPMTPPPLPVPPPVTPEARSKARWWTVERALILGLATTLLLVVAAIWRTGREDRENVVAGNPVASLSQTDSAPSVPAVAENNEEPQRKWPLLYPRIPTQPGAYVKYAGKVWTAGLPPEASIPYDATLRFLGEQPAEDGAPCWRIEVETTSRGSGDHHEAAVLLIDRASYESEQTFVIRQGWLTARSDQIADHLSYLAPDAALDGLTVELRSNRDTPKLKEEAERLQLTFPPDRVGVAELLVIMFGAEDSAAPLAVRQLRSVLAGESQRVVDEHVRDDLGAKGVTCWVLRSRDPDAEGVADAPYYELWGSDEVPFSFVEARVQTAGFQASMLLTTQGAPSVPLPVDVALDTKLAAAAKTLQSTHVERAAFDRAILPADSARSVFSGHLQRGPVAKVEFEARVQMVGSQDIEGVSYRWMEVVAESGEAALSHREAAKLLVDERRYADEGDFEIHHGWFVCQGETFPLDPRGEIREVDDALLRLKDSPLPENRVGIHDVLTLLFDAELKASQPLGQLRRDVAKARVAAGSDRLWRIQKIKVYDGPEILGEVWEVTSAPGMPFSYRVERSRQIPFDFNVVRLDRSDAFHLFAFAKNFEPRGAKHELADEGALAAAAEKTRLDLRKIEEEDRNTRIWRDKAGKRLALAEFGGLVDGGQIVLLWKKDGEELRIPKGEFSQEDQDWIAAGRWWTWIDPQTRARIGPARATFHGIRNRNVTLLKITGSEPELREIPRDWLSAADQVWVRKWEKSRNTSSRLKTGIR